MMTPKLLLFACVSWMCGHVMAVPAPGGFCSAKSNGDYKHPNSCGEHIKCSNGMAHVFDCPVNLVWHDGLKRCEYVSDDAACNNPPPFSCVGRPSGNYAYPGDCSKFYMCSNEHKWAMDCPATTHYDVSLKVCNHVVDANCVL
ncbi:peritrophin-1-like [Pecten maximus]|uniref:peritrophin-1-like n=1 Tax=Pecten maximus TaxID=6579 RepID=UPI001457E78B|nr:peritrophin-1-like [Pecten maximus]